MKTCAASGSIRTMVAFDGKSTAILVGAPGSIYRTKLHKKLTEILLLHATEDNRVSITGSPVAEALLGTHILEDLGVPKWLLGGGTRGIGEYSIRGAGSFYRLRVWITRHVGLVPISILMMLVIFQISFRRLLASLLPMAEVGACLLFTFGLMGWLGVPNLSHHRCYACAAHGHGCDR